MWTTESRRISAVLTCLRHVWWRGLCSGLACVFWSVRSYEDVWPWKSPRWLFDLSRCSGSCLTQEEARRLRCGPGFGSLRTPASSWVSSCGSAWCAGDLPRYTHLSPYDSWTAPPPPPPPWPLNGRKWVDVRTGSSIGRSYVSSKEMIITTLL